MNTQVHKQHRPGHFRACTASLPLEISLTLSLAGAVQSCIGLQVHGLALRTSTSVHVGSVFYDWVWVQYVRVHCTDCAAKGQTKHGASLMLS